MRQIQSQNLDHLCVIYYVSLRLFYEAFWNAEWVSINPEAKNRQYVRSLSFLSALLISAHLMLPPIHVFVLYFFIFPFCLRIINFIKYNLPSFSFQISSPIPSNTPSL